MGASFKNPYLIGALVIVAVLVIVGAYLYLASPGYGDQEEEPQAGTPQQEAKEAQQTTGEVMEVKVRLYEWGIEPSEIRVPPGTTVRFVIVNEGRYTHAFEIEREDIGFEASSKTLGPGQDDTLEVTFEEPGTYEIYCPIGNHRALGMEGVIIVGEGGGGSAGASDEAKDSTQQYEGISY
ncbi:MAG: cupredoxin domain-containing protein [Desulfurococcales archaeon]|nr:cupredoxin domain-containing protein [Desulfurococcales archaeon]